MDTATKTHLKQHLEQGGSAKQFAREHEIPPYAVTEARQELGLSASKSERQRPQLERGKALLLAGLSIRAAAHEVGVTAALLQRHMARAKATERRNVAKTPVHVIYTKQGHIRDLEQ